MEERLIDLKEEATLEKLVDKVNEVIGKKFQILDEEDDIEKWNTVPKLLLLDDSEQKRLLEFLDYMDSLLTTNDIKAMYIVSLSGLIEFGKIKLTDYDDGSLFVLADYYQNSSIKEIEDTLPITKNQDLLLAVRKKTLDNEARCQILKDITNKILDSNIDTSDSKKFSKVIENEIKELENKDYYELIEEK